MERIKKEIKKIEKTIMVVVDKPDWLSTGKAIFGSVDILPREHNLRSLLFPARVVNGKLVYVG